MRAPVKMLRRKLLRPVVLPVLLVGVCFLIFQVIRPNPRKLLEEKAQWTLPPDCKILAFHFASLEKDPRYYWALSHSPETFNALLANGFRAWTGSEAEAYTEDFKEVFPSMVSHSDRILFSKDINGTQLVILTDASKMHSFVGILYQ